MQNHVETESKAMPMTKTKWIKKKKQEKKFFLADFGNIQFLISHFCGI